MGPASVRNGELARRPSRRWAWVAGRLLAAALVAGTPWRAGAIELGALWDFDDPARSEQRLRDALGHATGDDAFVLRTQIARTFGLRGDFATAQDTLRGLEPLLPAAGDEARARYWLELGRTYASAAHAPSSQTPETKARARAAYDQALQAARHGRLDDLTVDALHMFAFVDTAPAERLRWGLRALAVVQSSTQPSAQRWEASIRNNVGEALYDLGRYDEALAQFEQAVVLRERATNPRATRAAAWMVGWTLRALQRTDEALAIQRRLEQENDAAGTPDADVFEELELLYRTRGDEVLATHYAALKLAAQH